MPAEIPAGRETFVRKQSIDACLWLRRIVEKLRFAVFLQDGIEMLHRNRSVRATTECHADLEDSEIGCIDERRCANRAERCREQQSS